MNKILQLKIASMLLFWFGVGAELITVWIAAADYATRGYSNHVPIFPLNDIYDNLTAFTYPAFAHFVHIVSAYWLSKGKKKGWLLGISISLFEIVTFLVPIIQPEVYTPDGFAIRVLFGIIIFLIISGRKELDNLQAENWRPWKSPKKIHGNYPVLMQDEKPFDLTPVSKLRIVIGILLTSAGIILIVAQSTKVLITDNFLEFNIPAIAGIVIGISMFVRWERSSKSKI